MSDLSRLPHEPEAFFEISGDYDRRDLKRAYGRAIRTYKPETHPDEFQLIRRAYEQLEAMLRYQRGRQDHAASDPAWQADRAAPRSEPGRSADPNDSGHATNPSRPTAQRSPWQLAVLDPAEALRSLESQARPTAPDYYLAAILRDAVAGRRSDEFLTTILEGLAAHPNDAGLAALAAEFLRSEVPDNKVRTTIESVARKISTPHFFRLSEPLWLRLLNLEPFDDVAKLLVSCERTIPAGDLATRQAFLLRFLRSAIWVAPDDWVAPRIDELESAAATMNAADQADLETIAEIREVLAQDRDRPEREDVRGQFLKAFRMQSQSDDPESVATTLMLLQSIADDPESVRRDFPRLADPRDRPWLILTYRLIHQLQPILPDADEVDEQRALTQAFHVTEDLWPSLPKIANAHTRASSWFNTVPQIIYVIVGTIFVFIPLMAISMVAIPDPIGTIASVAGLVSVIVAMFISYRRFIFPRFLRSRHDRYHKKFVMAAYRPVWRPRLFRAVRSGTDPVEVFSRRIERVCARTSRQALGTWIDSYLRQDTGLAIFAALQTIKR